jgi:hypothetical protein
LPHRSHPQQPGCPRFSAFQKIQPASLAKFRLFRAMRSYSIFEIGVDRKQDAQWLFPQEKATFQAKSTRILKMR